jgi:hypothetical protein
VRTVYLARAANDVAEDHAPPRARQREHVVEVAAHHGAAATRQPPCGDAQPGDFGELSRQKAFLQRRRELSAGPRDFTRVFTRLGVEQVGSRDVGEDLRPDEIGLGELERCFRIQLQRAELPVVQTQREAVNRTQPGLRSRGREPNEGRVAREVPDCHVSAGAISLQAWSFLQVHLQRFDVEDHVVRRGHEVMLGVADHQQDASAVDRDDFDDMVDEMIQDRLDREVARQRPCEVDQHAR